MATCGSGVRIGLSLHQKDTRYLEVEAGTVTQRPAGVGTEVVQSLGKGLRIWGLGLLEIHRIENGKLIYGKMIITATDFVVAE